MGSWTKSQETGVEGLPLPLGHLRPFTLQCPFSLLKKVDSLDCISQVSPTCPSVFFSARGGSNFFFKHKTLTPSSTVSLQKQKPNKKKTTKNAFGFTNTKLLHEINTSFSYNCVYPIKTFLNSISNSIKDSFSWFQDALHFLLASIKATSSPHLWQIRTRYPLSQGGPQPSPLTPSAKSPGVTSAKLHMVTQHKFYSNPQFRCLFSLQNK